MPLPEKKCPGCGVEFRHDPRITFEFCPDCGARLPESQEQQQGSQSILERMVSFPDAAGIALAALGHVRGVADRCTARYKDQPHVPRPQNPPIWCDLRAGHEGPHQHATCRGWVIMDREQLIEMRTLPEVCQGCGTKWPCSIAEKIIKAFAS